jgi:hypothetical protein
VRRIKWGGAQRLTGRGRRAHARASGGLFIRPMLFRCPAMFPRLLPAERRRRAPSLGTVRNLVCGAIVTLMEGAYGN